MITSIEKTSDYLSTEELRRISRYFHKEGNYRMALLIDFGFRTLLRYSDLDRIRWVDILNKDELILNEKKTNKRRKIALGVVLRGIISNYYELYGKPELNERVFRYTLRHTNRLLQIGAASVGIRKKNVSTHSLRKSGSRYIWETNGNSDEYLIKLSYILNHSSTTITRRYLSIQREEIKDIYQSFDEMM